MIEKVMAHWVLLRQKRPSSVSFEAVTDGINRPSFNHVPFKQKETMYDVRLPPRSK
jgi:hypothetical protein